MIVVDSNAIARELSDWFLSVRRLVDNTWFAVAPPGPHRDAVVLDTLKRNGRILAGASLDSADALYLPLCFYLAAACTHLNAELVPAHWRAAVDNVRELQRNLDAVFDQSVGVGLDFGTPVSLFKAELEEALHQTGLIQGVTFLSKEDQRVALGLSVNWAMRLLLAYALENRSPDSTAAPEKKDLAWLGRLVRPALA
ncbi:MAG: hypothetical protein QM757_27325 [Paludibaculum sp.]